MSSTQAKFGELGEPWISSRSFQDAQLQGSWELDAHFPLWVLVQPFKVCTLLLWLLPGGVGTGAWSTS